MPSKPCLRSANAAASPVPPPPTTTTLFTSGDCRDAVEPVVGIGRGASLYVNQRLAQAHRDLARLSIADGPRTMRRLDGSNRRDHRGGATGEDLGQGPVGAAGTPLLSADLALFSLVPEVSGQREQRVPSDSWQQRSGQSRRQQPGFGSAAEHETQVHPSHLLDPAVL